MTVNLDLSTIDSATGTDLGHSRWIEIDQHRIDLFAECTEDPQWIHVDPARAASGPFGTTIAHGFLSLSLISAAAIELLVVNGAGMIINYGLNRVRFPASVPVGSRVRGQLVVGEVQPVPGGRQVTLEVTMEVEGGDKPACVAQMLVRCMADSAQGGERS